MTKTQPIPESTWIQFVGSLFVISRP